MRISNLLPVSTAILAAFSALGCSRAPGGLRTFQMHSHIPMALCKGANVRDGALCGSYEVYEDREKKTGRKIRLNIIVFPARSSNPAPDPVFVFAGGPGGAATHQAGRAGNNPLREIGSNRDVVLVDQRGTGNSNPLNCDLSEDPADMVGFFGELFPLEKVRACRHNLEQIADLTLYSTPIAMDDLDEVRDALGYDKINLDGSSYGTIAAQVYMRQHPQHVRAVVLMGVANPAIRQPLLFPRAAQSALNFLIEDCAADEQCHAAFPNFKNEFGAVIAKFDKGPVNAELVDPHTKQMRTVPIMRESFVERVRLLLYSPGSARFVPMMIHHAYENDFLPFQSLSIASNLGPSLARGMYLTVTCSEGVAFITEDLLEQETKGTFVGDRRVRAHMDACREWPRAKIAPDYINLVNSSAPVLMISGEIDGATPPWYGEDALKHFSNGRQVKFRYLGHAYNNSCVGGLVTQFIKNGSKAGLDTSCAATIPRPPFATTDAELRALP